ncbi:hypothetical protein [Nocardia africana]|uniref:Uncharacterized protein n=1 Tax=Nocardia africana TaxID=134964 RepID=A0A378WRG9_9NOCA|nr:hypothetical protein [Nocardia africana]MCC3314786.1 hypothetical protein [Nocardia africana]SUA42933.1 Uncharacterised protein [Nocardia africana]
MVEAPIGGLGTMQKGSGPFASAGCTGDAEQTWSKEPIAETTVGPRSFRRGIAARDQQPGEGEGRECLVTDPELAGCSVALPRQ